MRDPKRIDMVIKQLEKVWKEVPDWRFGQLIMNILSYIGKDPFYIEDDKMLEILSDLSGNGGFIR